MGPRTDIFQFLIHMVPATLLCPADGGIPPPADTRKLNSLNITATRSESGDKLVLHIVNSSARQQKIQIKTENAGTIKSINGLSLSGSLSDANSPREPEKIIPKEFTLPEPSATLEPYSYTIIAIDCDGTDGIASVKADKSSQKPATYYNLSGQAVTSPSHGIYITDAGEKISL